MERRRRYINVFIVALALCTLATWALGLSSLKYKPESSIAFLDGFPGDSSQWQAAGDWSNVDIGEERITVHRESDDRSYAKRRFVLPEYPARADHQLRIRGVIQANNSITGNLSDTRGAAYMVWLEGADGEIERYATVRDLAGDQQIYQAQRILAIPDSVSAIVLVMNTRDSEGSFSLIDASAEIVSVTTLYLALATVLLVSWLIVAAFAALWLFRYTSLRTALMTGLLGGAIVVGVLLPETITIPFVEPLFQRLAQWLPLAGTESGEFTYKIGHFLFFFLTSLVLMRRTGAIPITRLQIACIMLLLAVATEGMQLHLLNRSTQLFDIGVDTLGILLAWAASMVLAPKRRRKTEVWRRRSARR